GRVKGRSFRDGEVGARIKRSPAWAEHRRDRIVAPDGQLPEILSGLLADRDRGAAGVGPAGPVGRLALAIGQVPGAGDAAGSRRVAGLEPHLALTVRQGLAGTQRHHTRAHDRRRDDRRVSTSGRGGCAATPAVASARGPVIHPHPPKSPTRRGDPVAPRSRWYKPARAVGRLRSAIVRRPTGYV